MRENSFFNFKEICSIINDLDYILVIDDWYDEYFF